MSKIIVPQEQVDAIIDLYVNKQYGLGRIVKTLNLPFHQSVVKRVLKENNIHIRTFQEAKVGCPKLEVPQELQNQIIALYEEGYGLEKIVESLQLTFSFDKVRSILIDNNVHIRNVQESAQVKIMPDLRKYHLNDNYNLESHNGAWLLGFLAADGYLPITKGAKNKIVLTLARRDEEVLHLIKEELNYDGPIYQNEVTLNGKVFYNSSLSITSKVLREKCENYGIVNAKTFKFNHIPDIPEEYILDFIRGFFDGDGSIYEYYEKNGCYRVGMSFTCANKNLLQEFSTFLQSKGLSPKNIVNDHNNFAICYRKQDTLKLGKLFYENDYLSLPRKKEKYFSILNKIQTPTSLNTPQE